MPPDSAIHRLGDELDDRMFSIEARLLRLLVNDQREPKDRLKTIDELIERAKQDERRKAIAEARHQQAMRRGVPDA